MSASTIPLVLAKLDSLCTAAFPNFIDGGPKTNEEMDGVYLCADESGDAPITFDQTWAGQGSQARNEVYVIPGLVFARTGDNDPDSRVALRTAGLAAFQTFSALFRPDASLGIPGYTLRAQVTGGELDVIQTSRGLLARVKFAVTVEARI